MTAPQRAAALVVAIGPEAASSVLGYLDVTDRNINLLVFAAVFQTFLPSSVLDKNTSHCLRGRAEEMTTSLPIHLAIAAQAERRRDACWRHIDELLSCRC